MEIEVGDFVRTNKGYITKMTSEGFIKILLEGKSVFGKPLKHSKNIIDLIEVGDLIKTKGEKTIIHIYDNDTLEAVKEDIKEGHFTIESIVTHEMFESIEYKVEESK